MKDQLDQLRAAADAARAAEERAAELWVKDFSASAAAALRLAAAARMAAEAALVAALR